MNGKGSKRRPTFVPLHEFGDNWARIFEKQKQAEKEKENADSNRTKSDEERDPNNGRDGRND